MFGTRFTCASRRFLSLWLMAVSVSLSGCATTVVTQEVKGVNYSLSFNEAYLDGSRLVLEWHPTADPRFRSSQASVEMADVHWYAPNPEMDMPVGASLKLKSGPLEARPPHVVCVPVSPGTCEEGAERKVVLVRPDGSRHPYQLDLTHISDPKIGTVYLLRAAATDSDEVLYSKVGLKREGSPLAVLLYPIAVVADIVTAPFVIVMTVAASH